MLFGQSSGALWVEAKLNAVLIAVIDHPLDQQVDDPGLLLRVEHIPELGELDQGGGDMIGVDCRLLDGAQSTLGLPEPPVHNSHRFFELAEPFAQRARRPAFYRNRRQQPFDLLGSVLPFPLEAGPHCEAQGLASSMTVSLAPLLASSPEIAPPRSQITTP